MSKCIKVGSLLMGGGSPVSIQSMLSAKREDCPGAVAQAQRLEKAGCDIVRIAIPTMEATDVIPLLKESIKIPIVADIHLDYRLALASVEKGIEKVRINPGNIGD